MTLTIRPDERGRWQWSVGRQSSTFGYPTAAAAEENARWREDVAFDAIRVSDRTRAQEIAIGEALLWELERTH